MWKIELEKDDCLVLVYPQLFHGDALERMKADIRELFPGHKLMLLEEGTMVGVIKAHKAGGKQDEPILEPDRH